MAFGRRDSTVTIAATFAAASLSLSLMCRPCSSFSLRALAFAGAGRTQFRRGVSSSPTMASSVVEEAVTGVVPDPEAARLKDDLIALAAATRRGFSASRSDRERAKRIIGDLSGRSPSDEPASAYYGGGGGSDNRASLAGKWTLVYTDAPDITSLEGGPLSTAKLGRIGQECFPPSIKNVIEWRRPDWASSLPFSAAGGEGSRVIQKVCCEGSATSKGPKTVDLKLLGLELSGASDGGADGAGAGGLSALLKGPAALLEDNPVKLQGPLTAPFGKFDILYLDDDMRITRTYQGYYAVNIREEEDWF